MDSVNSKYAGFVFCLVFGFSLYTMNKNTQILLSKRSSFCVPHIFNELNQQSWHTIVSYANKKNGGISDFVSAVPLHQVALGSSGMGYFKNALEDGAYSIGVTSGVGIFRSLAAAEIKSRYAACVVVPVLSSIKETLAGDNKN